MPRCEACERIKPMVAPMAKRLAWQLGVDAEAKRPFNACASAAWVGDLGLLMELHECGEPWDFRTCTNAAYKGHLPCLMYAYIHRAPHAIVYRHHIKGFVDARRKRAAMTIALWWKHAMYAPGGPGYRHAKESFSERATCM